VYCLDCHSSYTQRHAPGAAAPIRPEAGSIESYLGTPVVPSYVLHQYGGVILYWSDQLERRPRPARVVLDYLAAPGEPFVIIKNAVILITFQ
jgi:hypothetical protein